MAELDPLDMFASRPAITDAPPPEADPASERHDDGGGGVPGDPLTPATAPSFAGMLGAAPAAVAGGVQRATDLTGVLTLKHDSLFLLTDAFGDVHPDSRGLGLYAGDTRALSRYELRLNGVRPVVLRTGSGASFGSTLQLTNPDVLRDPGDKADPDAVLSRQSLGIVRERLLADGFRERIDVQNFTMHREPCRVVLRLDADFADIFEVRGVQRERRGERLPNRLSPDRVGFAYRGLDGRLRRTLVYLSEPARVLPGSLTAEEIEAALRSGATAGDDPRDPARAAGPVLFVVEWVLEPGASRRLEVTVTSEIRDGAVGDAALRLPAVIPTLLTDEPEAMHRAWRSSSASVSTGHLYIDRAFGRALTDLRLLVNNGPGPDERYVAAGVPWFACLFGRDSIITALQTLCIRPQLARDTLTILARLQATETDPWRDAQPGKILHELRTGELAAAGEIPHSPYYGSVDSTPLWLILLGEYERWTGDAALVDRLWPHALAALAWIDEHGDFDGDGFVEYERRSPRGLLNQGWKDSVDANRHRDGRLARGSLALVEVQGYVHRARLAMARLARGRGDVELADVQDRAADRLRAAFEAAFWMDDVGTYALALDGEKRPVDAVASNPGHALWAGIAAPDRAARVAASLMSPEMWSGWGIRTLSSEMAGYNPIGYHLGSVWPHDNAMSAGGLLRYGFTDQATRIAGAMLEATIYFRDSRLPELFCGFDRSASPYPVPYPVACSPQAWAAGSLFQLLEAMLGFEPDAASSELRLIGPSLPAWLSEVRIDNLRVGEAVVDLLFRRTGESTAVEVLRRTGDLSVLVRV